VRIEQYLDDLLDDLEELKPRCLSDICHFVKSHKRFVPITMMARNVDRSGLYLHDLGVCFTQAIRIRPDAEMTDIQLAALLCLVGEVHGGHHARRYDALVSSTSKETGKFHWSRAMATSYLLFKEVASEKIRQSA